MGVDDLSGEKIENIPHEIDFIHGDLASNETINKLSNSCISVLHLAGQSFGEMSFDDPILDLKKNSITTLNMIKYGINIGVKKMLFASSVSISGSIVNRGLNESDFCNPSSCYGVSKLASKGYLRIYSKQLPYINIRMFNV